MVGSGPYVVTEFDRGRIIRMSRNPNFRGPKPKFDELQWIKYGSADAVERALTLGEIDIVPEVAEATFARLGKAEERQEREGAVAVVHPAGLQPLHQGNCPDAKFNPAVQDLTVRQAIAYAIDRERINEIASRDIAFAGHGLLP